MVNVAAVAAGILFGICMEFMAQIRSVTVVRKTVWQMPERGYTQPFVWDVFWHILFGRGISTAQNEAFRHALHDRNYRME